MSDKKYTKEYLIKSLIDLSNRKNSISLSKEDVDCDLLTPSSATYKRYFGNWSVALDQAGLKTGIITGRPQDDPIFLTEKAIEILSGELLGDGHMSSSGSNSGFQHSTANIEYGNFVYNKLKEQNVPLLEPEIIPERNNGKKQFRTRTSCNVSFSELREKWYINGVKVVPKDLELTAEMSLHWFLGDGTLDGSGVILISTCNFLKEDVDFLVEKLNKLGIKSSVNRDGKYYLVRIWKNSVKDFFNYIGPCPIESYGYKWGKGKWIDYKTTN